MMRSNSCPRCKKGNIMLDWDYYGWTEFCIQCGYTRELKSMVGSGQQRYYEDKKRGRRVGSPGKGR